MSSGSPVTLTITNNGPTATENIQAFLGNTLIPYIEITSDCYHTISPSDSCTIELKETSTPSTTPLGPVQFIITGNPSSPSTYTSSLTGTITLT